MATNSKAMLEHYPRTLNVDADLLARTLDTIVECANTNTHCADACMAEDNVAEMVKCARLNLDCADVCSATARVLSRQADYDANLTRSLLEACAVACKACGDECAQHAEKMAHCKVCADACRRSEQACRELLDAIS